MNFSTAQAYLLGMVNEVVSRREPGRLDRMRALLRELGDPQDRYPTVHVGGTSGKGSTCTMIAAILTSAGHKTGLHTKPHLRSVVERARIDGMNIPEETFADLLGEMLPAIERVAAEYTRPSYYETLLALAFLYFAQQRVDVAVIEVGIGGKLDGTNVLHPLVSVITNIGLDHTEILGETLEEIAADKAGIAKAGVPLVSCVADPGPRRVIENQCRQAGAPFLAVRDITHITAHASNAYSQSFQVTTPEQTYEVALPLLGDFQQENCATALVACELLPQTLRPDRDAAEMGLSRLNLAGRMELFPSHPAVIFDVAHNHDKAQHLARALAATFPDRRFIFVLAIGQSKDAQGIISAFAALQSTLIFTEFVAKGRSAIKPQRLVNMAESLGVWGRAITDPVEALSIARRNAGADDIVVVSGSTFIVAELREWWMEHVNAGQTAG